MQQDMVMGRISEMNRIEYGCQETDDAGLVMRVLRTRMTLTWRFAKAEYAAIANVKDCAHMEPYLTEMNKNMPTHQPQWADSVCGQAEEESRPGERRRQIHTLYIRIWDIVSKEMQFLLPLSTLTRYKC